MPGFDSRDVLRGEQRAQKQLVPEQVGWCLFRPIAQGPRRHSGVAAISAANSGRSNKANKRSGNLLCGHSRSCLCEHASLDKHRKANARNDKLRHRSGNKTHMRASNHNVWSCRLKHSESRPIAASVSLYFRTLKLWLPLAASSVATHSCSFSPLGAGHPEWGGQELAERLHQQPLQHKVPKGAATEPQGTCPSVCGVEPRKVDFRFHRCAAPGPSLCDILENGGRCPVGASFIRLPISQGHQGGPTHHRRTLHEDPRQAGLVADHEALVSRGEQSVARFDDPEIIGGKITPRPPVFRVQLRPAGTHRRDQACGRVLHNDCPVIRHRRAWWQVVLDLARAPVPVRAQAQEKPANGKLPSVTDEDA